MSVYCMVNIIELQCCCSVALKLSSYSWSYPLICSNNGSLYNLPSLVCFQWRFFLNVLMPQWDVAVSQGGMITQEWLLISLLDLFVLWALWHNLAAAGGLDSCLMSTDCCLYVQRRLIRARWFISVRLLQACCAVWTGRVSWVRRIEPECLYCS